MRETCTGKVNYHKVPVRKALKQQLLQVCRSMFFSNQMIDIHMVAQTHLGVAKYIETYWPPPLNYTFLYNFIKHIK